MSEYRPKIFFSYSHDTQQHIDWVLKLATRLESNGAHVILDQWDITLGGDLPRFMESGLRAADRVLAICTDTYVSKSNENQGGVGYEKMILTGQMMQNVDTDKIIPVIRCNEIPPFVPTFLLSRRYIDFRDDAQYETIYAELIRGIHGIKLKPRPPAGKNPFSGVDEYLTANLLFNQPERYANPALSGTVVFDYSDNNGLYVIGSGDMAFGTKWASASDRSIHVLNDGLNICTVALATNVKSIEDIEDATIYNSSSRYRTAELSEIVIWQNNSGYFAAVLIEKIECRSHGSERDEITFKYCIQYNKTPSFINSK